MKRIEPQLSILPDAQRRLWSSLSPLPQLGFVLYGGTAIALQLGHRQSVDFDFFTEHALDREVLIRHLPLLAAAEVVQDQPDTWTVLVSDNQLTRPVKVSFFGAIGFGRVGEPVLTSDGVLLIASLEDLLATKLKVLLQRVEAKDYGDIAALVDSGVSLEAGLASARLLFGKLFQPSECLKALVYFEGGDLETLNSHQRKVLVNAAKGVRDLPPVKRKSRSLSFLEQ
ncbi:MAG TPA: nucleotidyl transferase AbiEii/AbiGii toxin family protein [Paraburkholderia sp.]|uniref:nucleotidyl transferase AbiEii/AbiGii toxin family protein n=1 Tax=Paraburkholderia sp. TaxID=1926495 RepID=UPI002B495322|nr:nucleotidyl transferase AbiEii/AbiGii toxin family protein [Paraburkholderia sp.]HKR41681.1 nucleotidyl transferase AbiEii/AbiGii toxin family protein [Paraburkholderia sp.]